MKTLIKHLRAGQVYRRKHLTKYSSDLNRELQVLTQSGDLKKIAGGVYYKPRYSKYGELPPDDEKLITAILNTKNFLAFAPADLNSMGLGSTQLPNVIRVYNTKRRDRLKIAGRTYDFRIRAGFPQELTPEFLFVEFLNEYRDMAEEVTLSRERMARALKGLKVKRVRSLLKRFGKIHARKIYRTLYEQQHSN
jgi:hypothetical protein